MQIKVAVVSREGGGFRRLHRALLADGNFVVGSFLDPGQVERRLREWSFDVLLLRMDEFAPRHLAPLDRLRNLFPRAFLAVLASQIDNNARFSLRQRPGTAVLREDCEIGDLGPLLLRQWRVPGRPVRAFERAISACTIQITDRQGRVIGGRLTDLGRMGARLEITSHELDTRSRLVLKWKSEGQEQQFLAVIVWHSERPGLLGRWGGRQTLGVQFVAQV